MHFLTHLSILLKQIYKNYIETKMITCELYNLNKCLMSIMLSITLCLVLPELKLSICLEMC